MLGNSGEMLRLSLAQAVKQAQQETDSYSSAELMNKELVDIVSDYITAEKQGFLQRSNTADTVLHSQTELKQLY